MLLLLLSLLVLLSLSYTMVYDTITIAIVIATASIITIDIINNTTIAITSVDEQRNRQHVGRRHYRRCRSGGFVLDTCTRQYNTVLHTIIITY